MPDLATFEATRITPTCNVPPHPNDIDRRRIERAIEERIRYRYVIPEVSAIDDGYLVRSPCCSRNIDASGGPIDIACFVYNRLWSNWSLQYRDHTAGCWIHHSDHITLISALGPLLADPSRLFWP